MQKKDEKQPLRIKSLAELKRAIQPGTEIKALSHSNYPDLIGLVRVVTEVQTNAFYSKIKDQPNHRLSACNYGKGFRSDFEKAGCYLFDGTTVKVLNSRKNDGSLLYEMEVYSPENSMTETTKTEENKLNEYEKLHRMVQRTKETYPPGTRLVLINMDDSYAPVPSGTRGTVKYVDDIGQIGMAWDNGQSLSLVPGEDDFRQLTEEELSEGGRQVVNFGSKCKIRLPAKTVDCCKPGFLDKLREQCWELVKSYCTALGAEILTDKNGEVPMDAEIAQKVQDSILNTLWEYGVEMRTDDFCIDADEMQALRTRLSHMDEDFLSDNNVYCFRSVDELFDYFYDEEVSKEELVRDLNTEQKVKLLSSFKERILQADGMYYCYNEGFADFEFDEDNAPSMEM